MQAVQENTMPLTGLRVVARTSLEVDFEAGVNDTRVTFELLSYPGDAGPRASETKLFATIQSTVIWPHPHAKVIPVMML